MNKISRSADSLSLSRMRWWWWAQFVCVFLVFARAHAPQCVVPPHLLLPNPPATYYIQNTIEQERNGEKEEELINWKIPTVQVQQTYGIEECNRPLDKPETSRLFTCSNNIIFILFFIFWNFIFIFIIYYLSTGLRCGSDGPWIIQ